MLVVVNLPVNVRDFFSYFLISVKGNQVFKVKIIPMYYVLQPRSKIYDNSNTKDRAWVKNRGIRF